MECDGIVQVEVVLQETRTFDDFEGYDGAEATDSTAEHDSWGVE